MTAHILIVEDEAPLRTSIAIAFKRAGWFYREASSVAEAVAAFATCAFDIVLSDMRLPDGNGVDVLAKARELVPDARVLIMTAYGTVENAVEAMQLGAFDFIQKPFAPQELLHRVQRVIEHMRLEGRVRRLQGNRDPIGEMVGESGVMRRVQERIRQVAEARAVLITGETGTGKELAARGIHAIAGADEPFVVVNCAGLSETVLDSELFGHVRGAFTGAADSRKGLLEEADGGTLFLDEVGEIPLLVQAKLLRFLQFGEVRPIGANTVRTVHARVLAATNRDLAEEVEQGRFREDLLYRLDVARVELPALRERGEDLPVLCEKLLARIAARLHRRPATLATGAIDQLMGHDWPGNVRELENLLERAVLTAESQVLQANHMSPTRRRRSTAAADLAGVERKHILQVLEQSGGDRKLACASLGISRSTLRRKLIEYGQG